MQLIIIIGLPGSGKTYYSNQFKDYTIFDDFVTHFYNGKVLKSIKDGEKVCLIDPRLCIFNVFERCITEIELYIPRTDIKLVLFENTPSQCVKNVKNRDTRIVTSETIQAYSEKYKLNNYDLWKCVHNPVYKLVL
jgi:hypothetical protein